MKNFIFVLALLAASAFSQSRKVYIDALVDNHSKALLATSTQVGYLAGVTADIQTQINNAGGGSGPTPVMEGVTLTPALISSAALVEVIPAASVGPGKKFLMQGASLTFIGGTSGIISGAGTNDCRLLSSTSLTDFLRANMSLMMNGGGSIDTYILPNPSGGGTVLQSYGPGPAQSTPAFWLGGAVGEGVSFQCPSSGVLTCMGPGSPTCEMYLQVWGVVK